jgi:hypothetical protein
LVRTIVEIGTAKVASLKNLSLRSIKLTNTGAAEIINLLGSVNFDFSHDGIGSGYKAFLSPQAQLTGLCCSHNPFDSLRWWTSCFPPYLCDLDISSLQSTLKSHEDLFPSLTSALASSSSRLCLQSVNISHIVTNPQSVILFLEVCLLCPLIQLKKLDITGCKLGDLVFQRLGQFLRTNRSLTTLRFDDQGSTVAGWSDFRGCLYGNKKLVEVPYPSSDVARFYQMADEKIAEGYSLIPIYKRAIKSAYRSKNYYSAQQSISQMVTVKIGYKELERAIGRASCVLSEIFSSVEQNATAARELKEQKKMDKLRTPKVLEMKERVCVKEGKLLSQLVRVLEKLRKTTGEGPPPLLHLPLPLLMCLQNQALIGVRSI